MTLGAGFVAAGRRLRKATGERRATIAALAAALAAFVLAAGIDWMWEDAYEESRHDAALLLDLLGHFPVERVEKRLREALEYKDPRLKHFALVSLLRFAWSGGGRRRT